MKDHNSERNLSQHINDETMKIIRDITSRGCDAIVRKSKDGSFAVFEVKMKRRTVN